LEIFVIKTFFLSFPFVKYFFSSSFFLSFSFLPFLLLLLLLLRLLLLLLLPLSNSVKNFLFISFFSSSSSSSFSQRLKLTAKILGEYDAVKTLPAKLLQQQPNAPSTAPPRSLPADGGAADSTEDGLTSIIDKLPAASSKEYCFPFYSLLLLDFISLVFEIGIFAILILWPWCGPPPREREWGSQASLRWFIVRGSKPRNQSGTRPGR